MVQVVNKYISGTRPTNVLHILLWHGEPILFHYNMAHGMDENTA